MINSPFDFLLYLIIIPCGVSSANPGSNKFPSHLVQLKNNTEFFFNSHTSKYFSIFPLDIIHRSVSE